MTSRRGSGDPNATGLATPALARHIRPGAVFAIRDEAVDFPESQLATAGPRTRHPTRRAIVVQAAVWGSSKRPRTVLVVPCSASQSAPTPPWDIQVPGGTPGFDAPNVVAYTSLVQPVLKSDLEAYYGDVDLVFLGSLRARLAQVLDLIEIDDDAVDDA